MSKLIRAAIGYSKHRSMYGLVVITCDTEERTVQVRLAKEWSRDMLHEIPDKILSYYEKIKWYDTYIDQLTAEHFINDLKRLGIPVSVINTQKDLKDPEDIEKLVVMDKAEMVSMFLKFRQKKQIEFHPRPTTDLQTLEDQMINYYEHKTEAGNIDYYASGDEHDNLTKALLICCFSVREYMEEYEYEPIVFTQLLDKDPYAGTPY